MLGQYRDPLPCHSWVPPSLRFPTAGGGGSQTLTPRELLQRLLEWGEPLRSRDTCFRTSAATVLWGQEGGSWGQENLGSGALGTGASEPTNSFHERKIQAMERKKIRLRAKRTQASGATDLSVWAPRLWRMHRPLSSCKHR